MRRIMAPELRRGHQKILSTRLFQHSVFQTGGNNANARRRIKDEGSPVEYWAAEQMGGWLPSTTVQEASHKPHRIAWFHRTWNSLANSTVGGRVGEAGLRVTATKNSTPSGSQTDCTREHVKNHGTAIFHGKPECYINVISAVLLKKTQAGNWNAEGSRPSKALAPEVTQSLERRPPESWCGSVSQSSQHRGSHAGCRKQSSSLPRRTCGFRPLWPPPRFLVFTATKLRRKRF